MIRIQDTKNMIGITIHGDLEDLQTLYSALSDYLRFYFDHQEEPSEGYSCYETLLGLCYDIRHAFQGDRNVESVKNNHENIAQLASCIYKVDHKAIQKERDKYKNGNLYFNVEVLYPWAVYYLYTLHNIVEDYYRFSWFKDDEFGYTEYQANRDLTLIRYFVQLLWEKLHENLSEEMMRILWDYLKTYNRVDYYFYYSELYMSWICTYWVKAFSNSSQRKEMLPLLCLGLCSILEEDPDELEEAIEEAKKLNMNHTGNKENVNKNDSSESSSEDREKEMLLKVRNYEADNARNILRGMEIYDEYYEKYSQNEIPYQDIDDFTEEIDDYIQEHGQFTELSFDEWLDDKYGEIDWDILEW